MWRLLLVLGLLIGLGTRSAPAQQWSGSAALGLSAGHQTNLYLDPVLGTWYPDAQSPFFALTPRVGFTRDGSRTRVDLTVRSRLHTRRTDRPQFTQSMISLRHRLSPNWTVGLLGGGTRYRYPASQTQARTARDSWWGLPSLRWTPTSETMLTLRTGLTQRFERLPSVTDRQTSGLASVRATHWLTDRVQVGGRLYYSSGRTSTAETQFGGTGGSLSSTYWPSNTVSIRGNVAIEQLQYETIQPSGQVRENIHRAGAEVTWRAHPSITAFGRTEALYAALAGTDRRDVHTSVGLRLQTERVFGGSASSPVQRRVCHDTDEGLRIQIPYDKAGTPHVTGDFNNWSLPGIPLESTGENAWEATLDLPPGRYAYRLRVVDGDDARWLDLPSYAQTAKDPFGGTNGVCTIN